MKLKKIFTSIICASLILSNVSAVMASELPDPSNSQELDIQTISYNNDLSSSLESYYKNLPTDVEIDEDALTTLLEQLDSSRTVFSTRSSSYTLYSYQVGNQLHILMDKDGYEVIKSIIAIGGGATVIGGAICEILSIPYSAPIAAAIGGYMAMQMGWIELQFALGYEIADIAIPLY